jgi:hypothetical protein
VTDDEQDKTDKLPTIRKLPTHPIRVILPNAPIRVTNILDDIAALFEEERAAYLANIGRDKRALDIDPKSDELSFSHADLNDFVSHRKAGLAKKSVDWIDRASNLLWESTAGELSSRTLTALREHVLAKYKSADSHSKILNFAVSFLKFLAKTKMEPRYASFEAFLEMPKAVKERKSVTSRIVTTSKTFLGTSSRLKIMEKLTLNGQHSIPLLSPLARSQVNVA